MNSVNTNPIEALQNLSDSINEGIQFSDAISILHQHDTYNTRNIHNS